VNVLETSPPRFTAEEVAAIAAEPFGLSGGHDRMGPLRPLFASVRRMRSTATRTELALEAVEQIKQADGFPGAVSSPERELAEYACVLQAKNR
jgi:hypothetical protein